MVVDENGTGIKLNFNVGDYVDTKVNGHAFIVDILLSNTSDRVIVCAEFTYNFPNPRRFDMIVVEPGRMNGVDKWETKIESKDAFEFELVSKSDKLRARVSDRIGIAAGSR